MTEQEWLTSTEPWVMMDFLTDKPQQQNRGCSRRKLRLFACAAWRTIKFDVPLSENDDLPICEAVEAWADGGPEPEPQRIRFIGTHRLLDKADNAAESFSVPDQVADRPVRAALLREVFGNPFHPVVRYPSDVPRTTEKPAYYSNVGYTLFMDDWLTPDVCSLAQAAYDERTTDGTLDPVRLAVLSDALEEVGVLGGACIHCQGKGYHNTGYVLCDMEGIHDRRQKIACVACINGYATHPILEHLRLPEPHVRGCWVIDMLLGKE